MDLAEFLLARIAEDEAAAKMCAEVLADYEAKRQIVERFAQGEAEWAAACEDYSDWAAGHAVPDRTRHASVSRDGLNELARVLRLLALPYADHPDYRPEWRP